MDLPGEITAARDTASKLAGTAGDYAAGEQSVVDVLQSKIREAYSANQDLIGKLDTATQGYYNAPSEARVKYQDIFNPFQRENLVSQYTSNKAIPMLSNANLLGSRLGGIQGLVEAGTRAYGAQSARAQGKAQLAQQNYQNLLNEYQATAPQQQIVEAGKRKYLVSYDRNGNVVNKVDLGSASASGGSDFGFGDMFEIDPETGQIRLKGTNTQNNQNLEQPQYSPYKAGITQEWPIGSGVYWTSNNTGGWE